MDGRCPIDPGSWRLGGTLQKRPDFTRTYDQMPINSLSRKERLVYSRKSDYGKRVAEERTKQCHSLSFGKTPLIRKLAGYLELALLQRLRWKQHIEDSLRETAPQPIDIRKPTRDYAAAWGNDRTGQFIVERKTQLTCECLHVI